MSELVKDLVQTTKENFLSRKPVVGAALGAIVAVAVPTLLKLKGSPVVEEAVKATKSAATAKA